MHIHVYCGSGEAKFWLEPKIEIAKNYKLSQKQLGEAQQIIEAHQNEFKSAWKKHLGS